MPRPGKTAEESRRLLRRLATYDGPTHFSLLRRSPIEMGSADWRAERLTLSGPGGETVRGILTGPPGEWRNLPAVLYCHAHGNRYGIGASELTEGRPALLPEPYGPALARIGMAALSIDMPCFGERADETESATSKRLLWRGRTLFGAMLADLAGAFALLAAMAEVDSSHIAAFGFSMGATHAFWVGALEPGIARIAHACAFADLGTLIESGAHDLHGHYMTVPGLCAAFRTGEIAGLAAPRPQLALMGALDPLTPPDAAAIAIDDLRRCYAEAGAAPALDIRLNPGTGHQETPEMRAAVLAFLAAT